MRFRTRQGRLGYRGGKVDIVLIEHRDDGHYGLLRVRDTETGFRTACALVLHRFGTNSSRRNPSTARSYCALCDEGGEPLNLRTVQSNCRQETQKI